MRKPSVLIVFLTVFIDLVGFGIVIPLLPIYARNFSASGFTIGALMSTFSLMQFVFAPILGRLSDRVGRRPVLLTSTAGATISYLIFAYGSLRTGMPALALLFASRIFAGICGGNIGVAQAYIADITPPKERSKKMGLIGMAFGLGFIFGPWISITAREHFGPSGPGWVAASICAFNFLLALAILPESRQPGSGQATKRPHWEQWRHTLKQPKVGLLIGVFFLATFCFTCFETTLGLLVLKKFNIDAEKPDGITITGHLFMFAGIVGAVFQGGATGRLIKLLGEPRLVAISLFLVAISMAPIPFANTWWQIYLWLALLAIGSSMTRPPVFGMISNLTNAREQGVTIGVAQSAGSLARILGPIFAAVVFFLTPALPYLICAGVSTVAGIIAWQRLSQGYRPHHMTEATELPA